MNFVEEIIAIGCLVVCCRILWKRSVPHKGAERAAEWQGFSPETARECQGGLWPLCILGNGMAYVVFDGIVNMPDGAPYAVDARV